jgi:hypothetical protein
MNRASEKLNDLFDSGIDAAQTIALCGKLISYDSHLGIFLGSGVISIEYDTGLDNRLAIFALLKFYQILNFHSPTSKTNRRRHTYPFEAR